MKTLKEINEGCGEEFDHHIIGIIECGCQWKEGNQIYLCPTCEALKERSEEVLDEILNDSKFRDWCHKNNRRWVISTFQKYLKRSIEG